jgi:hypothetical protein
LESLCKGRFSPTLIRADESWTAADKSGSDARLAAKMSAACGRTAS